MTTPDVWHRRLPCTRAELEALRGVMFQLFAGSERDPNGVRGTLVAEYATDLAILLAAEGTGLQERFEAWHRGTPRFKVGWQAVRRGGRQRGRRRTTAPAPRRA